MNSNIKTTGMDMKVLLSTLWIFALLNVIIRDIHELFRPGLLQEMMTGTVNGIQMTEGLLLLAAIPMEILISMVLLSRVLKYRLNRWANISVGAMAIAFVIANGARDLDDMFFATVEVIAMALIVWYAWTWPKQEV